MPEAGASRVPRPNDSGGPEVTKGHGQPAPPASPTGHGGRPGGEELASNPVVAAFDAGMLMNRLRFNMVQAYFSPGASANVLAQEIPRDPPSDEDEENPEDASSEPGEPHPVETLRERAQVEALDLYRRLAQLRLSHAARDRIRSIFERSFRWWEERLHEEGHHEDCYQLGDLINEPEVGEPIEQCEDFGRPVLRRLDRIERVIPARLTQQERRAFGLGGLVDQGVRPRDVHRRLLIEKGRMPRLHILVRQPGELAPDLLWTGQIEARASLLGLRGILPTEAPVLIEQLERSDRTAFVERLVERIRTALSVAPAPPPRLSYDHGSRTITLDGISKTIKHPGAARIFEALYRADGEVVPGETLKKKYAAGTRPGRVIEAHLNSLFPDLIHRKPGKSGGFWIQPPPPDRVHNDPH